jgi:glycosyltransferase involved in cell wall biosynthesis
VIPAYNEIGRLPSTIDQVLRYVDDRISGVEVIVVDDGSKDGTAELIEHTYASRVRLIRNPGNRGKGYAVRNGMLHAQGEWILFSDADLSAPIEEAETLMRAVREQNAQVAIGSRAIDRSLIRVRQPWVREHIGRLFNLIMRGITGLPFQDTQCGFKLYSASAARQIFARQQLDGFSFDVEDLYIAKYHRIPVVEVPVRWSNAEGTKVSAMQGLKSFADLLRIRYFGATGRYR